MLIYTIMTFITSVMDTAVKKLSQIFSLSDYEARLYFAALEEGEATVSALAARADIPRTAVYPPLKSLTQKGFISPLKSRGKRILYRATEPKHLQHLFERKKIDLQEIVEQFSSNFMSGSGEVWVRYFEGREGILAAAGIFLNESKAKLWKSFENPALVERLVGAKQFDEYVNERVRRGTRSRIIIPAREHTAWMKELIEKSVEKLLEVRLVSPDEYPIDATVVVAGEWIFAESANKKPFALLIKNPPLARTVESIHDMVWDRWR